MYFLVSLAIAISIFFLPSLLSVFYVKKLKKQKRPHPKNFIWVVVLVQIVWGGICFLLYVGTFFYLFFSDLGRWM
ncbi:MAG: hypothetical protein ABIJ36_01710 [Patescibacteria group bacterium]|nr:hypothetical protein [Patescibacteria group bacterium]